MCKSPTKFKLSEEIKKRKTLSPKKKQNIETDNDIEEYYEVRSPRPKRVISI